MVDENTENQSPIDQNALLEDYGFDNDLQLLLNNVNQIYAQFADFHLFIVDPIVQRKDQPEIILPELLPDNTKEFVYPIYDYGNLFSTSKGEEGLASGSSMFKMFMTIEKIIDLLIKKLEGIGGIDSKSEVQIGFDGYLLCQRKAFESVINLSNYNVVVNNFDPGYWGEMYLHTIKKLADKGFGYPPEAPRDSYRKSFNQSPSMKTRG